MAKGELYKIRREGGQDSDQYVITKFDYDFNPIGLSYDVSEHGCTCPAGSRETCRHREMLASYLTNPALWGTDYMDYDKGEFVKAPIQAKDFGEQIEGLDEGEDVEGLDE